MPDHKIPGVYIKEKSLMLSNILSNETAIPSFIGFTQFAKQLNGEKLMKIKGSKVVCEPVLIQNFLEYEKAFGGADDTGDIMIVQNKVTGDYSANIKKDKKPYTPGWMHPSLLNFYANGGGKCYIISLGDYQAFDTTVKASDISTEMASIENAILQAELTTLILPTDLIGFGDANYYMWGTQLINFSQKEKKYFTIMDVIPSDPNETIYDDSDITNYRNNVKPDFPSYAAAYFPYLKSITAYAYKSDLSNIYFNGNKLSEIRAEDKTTEDVKTFLTTNYIDMPPSPFMAGIYCREDNATGVWKSPANVSPLGVIGPVVALTNKQQENMNVDPVSGISVNAIRSFTGRGTLVWGARTNNGNNLEWRYISVRRLFIKMETDLSMALKAYVFEPNDQNTWAEVKLRIENYLNDLYRKGAFAGATTDDAYKVLVGLNETMTVQDISNGLIRVTVIVAPMRPAEFIILTLSHKIGQ